MLTRCPQCGATFRVTDAHINAAQGRVRCGACMGIFVATDHLLSAPEPTVPMVSQASTQAAPRTERKEPVFTDEQAEPQAAAFTQTVVQSDAAATPDYDRDDFLIDDNSPLPEDEPFTDEDRLIQDEPLTPGDSFVRDEVLIPDESFTKNETGQDELSDELSEAALVAELEAALQDDNSVFKNPQRLDEAEPELDTDLDAILEEDDFNRSLDDISLESEFDQNLTGLDEQALTDAEAELDAILAEAEVESRIEPTPAFDSSQQQDLEAEEENFLFQDNPEEDIAEGRYHTGALLADEELSDSFKELDSSGMNASTQFVEDRPDAEQEAISDESWAEEMLEELEGSEQVAAQPAAESPAASAKEMPQVQEPAAEELHATPIVAYDRLRYEPIAVEEDESQGSNLLKILGWTLVNVALLVALAAQLAWFHYDKLARHDSLRPLYATACQWIGCTLPPLLDVSQIKSRNLVVRSHPKVNKALIIDVMVINQAGFAQPFPDIEFAFSDLNGNLVAQRVFAPAEYLSGEARDLREMPPETPVHISLEILDPGAEAVNYTMSFRHRSQSSS